MMNESGLTMVLHAVVIGIIAFIALVYGLKHPKDKSIDKSILVASIVLAYMIVFGHSLPSKNINQNLFF